MIDISLIILNYNTKNLLINLLSSLNKNKLGKYIAEIIVVDNNSTDGSQKYLKTRSENLNLKLILNKQNLGYSKGNNKAIKNAEGRYFLFLNSDTLLCPDTLFKMINFMDNNKEWAAATCRVELANGKLDPACHRGFPAPWAAFSYFSGLERLWPRSKLFGQYHQGWKALNKLHEINVISGAFFLIRKDVMDRVGYFDENFFMYGEDIDLCFRLKNKGYKICYYPDTKIIHYKKQSGRDKKKNTQNIQKHNLIKEESVKHFYETMKIFYDKHYQHKYPYLIRQLILLGIWLVSKLKK